MLPWVKVNVEDVGSAVDATGASTVVVAASDEVSANTGVTPATSDEVAIVAAVTQTTMRLLVSSRKNFDMPVPFFLEQISRSYLSSMVYLHCKPLHTNINSQVLYASNCYLF